MPERIQYRSAQAQDCQSIVEFNMALARETEGKQLPAPTVTEGVRALLAEPEAGFYIVAQAGDQVVACLMVTFEWSDWRNGFFWWIQSVYVKSDHRRRGVFKGLFEHVQSLSKGRDDVCGVRLYVERNNAAARQTYESLGMSQTPYLLYELGCG